MTFSDHLEAQTARKALDGTAPFNLAISTLSERRREQPEEKGEEEVVEEYKEWKNYAQMAKEQLGSTDVAAKEEPQNIVRQEENAETQEVQRREDRYSTKVLVSLLWY